jgi:AcrR family transcriptional regulator
MPRLTRKDMQQQTRQRLLVAAQEEIVRKGIGDVSIRDIAEAAGYSLGAIYSNFESKEAILKELAEVHMREEIRVFREIMAGSGQGEKEDVLNNISTWLKELQINKSLSALSLELQLYANRTPSFREKFDKEKAKRTQEFAEGLKTLFALHGLKPKIDFLQMAIVFAALWAGFSIQGTMPGAKPVDQVILDFLKALMDSAVPVE